MRILHIIESLELGGAEKVEFLTGKFTLAKMSARYLNLHSPATV